jgi:hypothetical protein
MSETPYHGPERRAVDRGGKPPCPDCGSDDSRVIDSGMPTMQPDVYLRRRACVGCGHRWTTYEHNSRAHTTSGVHRPPPTRYAV